MEGLLLSYFNPNLTYQSAGAEALPSLASQTALFPNVPDGTKHVIFTVRASTITLTFDGTTAPTTSVGVDYPAGTYELHMSKTELAKVHAINNGGTATGYACYFKSGASV